MNKENLMYIKLAGFLAVIFGSPFDVIKTRMMNSLKGTGESYKNPIDCVMKTLKKEVKSDFLIVLLNKIRVLLPFMVDLLQTAAD